MSLDDDNRIALQALPSEVTGEAEDDDYINAYMGDYINASYIDVSAALLLPPVCDDILCDFEVCVCECDCSPMQGYSKPKQYIACQGTCAQ